MDDVTAKLGPKQRQAIVALGLWERREGVPATATELAGETVGGASMSRAGALSALRALAGKGLVEQVGISFSDATTWHLTDAGRTAYQGSLS